jgi:hypothetical protein
MKKHLKTLLLLIVFGISYSLAVIEGTIFVLSFGFIKTQLCLRILKWGERLY